MGKRFIIFGEINKKLVLPLIAGLTQIIYSIINLFGDNNERDIFNKSFMNIIFISLGQMSVRLYPCILKISDKEKPNKKLSKKKKCLHYFLLCLIFFILVCVNICTESLLKNIDESPQISNSLFPNNASITFSTEMIFLVGLSTLFLKYKYFKHHIISLITLLLIGIILFIFFLVNGVDNILVNIIFRIIQTLIDAIYHCYQKYMMEKLYYPFWNIAFIPGLIMLILCATFLGISNYLEIRLILFDSIIFKIVIPFIYSIIMCPLSILIIYYFSPDFILIITLVCSITENIIGSNKNKNFLKYYFIPLYLIQIFALMVHLEIIELNFCGLNKNTRRNIKFRCESELLLDQIDSIDGNNNIDVNINYSIELQEKINEDINIEEEKDNQNFIES